MLAADISMLYLTQDRPEAKTVFVEMPDLRATIGIHSSRFPEQHQIPLTPHHCPGPLNVIEHRK